MESKKNDLNDFNTLSGFDTYTQLDHYLKHNNRNIGSLHGPDSPGRTDPFAGSNQMDPSSDARATGLHSASSDSAVLSGLSGTGLGTGSLVGTMGPSVALDSFYVSGDPHYYFNGHITEDVLHKYLDRNIQIQNFFM